jgi:hypothetical protein
MKAGRMAADSVNAETRPHLVIAFDDPDLVAVVQRRQVREGLDVGGPAEGREPPERARPERDFFTLDPELRVREQAVTGPVVVVKVGDQGDRHVGGLDPGALDHRRGAHVVADAARARVVVAEPGVDQEGLRTAEDQPHEVVECELVVGGLAIEELALRGVPLSVLERKNFVHGGSPSWRATVL